ncbi:hypothetical protein GCM10010299_11250 [Streptomyces tanashiensis]|nr:hypothetical protein GCM10010299_11250 [Streptomyces tanashiensis]
MCTVEEMGRQAARGARALDDAWRPPTARRLRLGTHVVVRDSAAPAPSLGRELVRGEGAQRPQGEDRPAGRRLRLGRTVPDRCRLGRPVPPVPADADRRENLYQHDPGVARLRRLFRAAAEAQSAAGA